MNHILTQAWHTNYAVVLHSPKHLARAAQIPRIQEVLSRSVLQRMTKKQQS